MKRDPSELPRYEIDQIGDLIALCQGTVTGKTAILSTAPGGNNFHDIYLLTLLQVRCVVQQAEHRALRIGFHYAQRCRIETELPPVFQAYPEKNAKKYLE